MMRDGLQGQLAGLMTMEDVAAYLNIAPLTAVRRARARKIPAFQLRPHGEWFCRPKDLDAWIDERAAEQGARLPSMAQIDWARKTRKEARP